MKLDDSNILSRKSYSGISTMIGARLEPRQNNYLSLYALAKVTTKSEVYRNLVIDWIEEQRKVDTEDNLIEEIVERINLQWTFERNREGMTFGIFKRKLEKELEKKGLKSNHITIILSKIVS